MLHSYKHIPLLLLAILLLFASISIAQKPVSKVSPKQTLKKAERAYSEMKFAIAAEFYEQYISQTEFQNSEILHDLANAYWQTRNYQKAFKLYQQLYPQASSEVYAGIQIRIAELYARKNNYESAAEWLSLVPGYEDKARAYRETALINEMKRDSLDWRLGFLSLNTPYREFSPYLKNNTLFFSSNKPLTSKQKSFGWDGFNYSHLWEIPINEVDSFDVSLINDSVLKQKPYNKVEKKLAEVYECGDSKQKVDVLQLPLNKRYTMADTSAIGNIIHGLEKLKLNVSTVTMDKNNHFYFTANYSKPDIRGVNRLRIMEGIYRDNAIHSIKALSFGNPNAYSVMHPAINAEGTLMVLSSDRPGGVGGYDLYYTTRKSTEAAWDTLTALGNTINTVGNEVFPSITPKDYLFFSSDGLAGLGGLDIYRVRIKEALTEKKPEVIQLGYPLNSSADDFGWTVRDAKLHRGFFTSDRFNTDDNLFSYTYNPKFAYFQGVVREKESADPIEGATVFLFNTKENVVYVAKSNSYGRYRFPIHATGKLVVKAIKTKYLSDCFSSRIVYDPQDKDTTFKAPEDLLLDKYTIGFAWRLKNTHYDFDKSEIRADAVPTLDSLISLTNQFAITLDSLVLVMQKRPITIEIGSHTDSRGTFEYNDKLSEERSASVVRYLVKHGVDPTRITAKGYGEYQLLNKCSDGVDCTKEEHQLNRRTEAKITGFIPPKINIHSLDVSKFKDGEIIDRALLPAAFFDECEK